MSWAGCHFGLSSNSLSCSSWSVLNLSKLGRSACSDLLFSHCSMYQTGQVWPSLILFPWSQSLECPVSLSDLNIRGRKKNARHVRSRISLNLCFELLCPLSISRQVSCWPNPRPCLESWNAFKKCSLVFYVSNRQLKPILSLLPLFAFIKSRLCH